jgi:uncharacterized membrane protein YvbJ
MLLTYFLNDLEMVPVASIIIIIIIIIIVTEFSPGGSSPYTSTDKTVRVKYI